MALCAKPQVLCIRECGKTAGGIRKKAGMVNRPCLDCGALSPHTRCDAHRKQRDNKRYAQRGTTTQRGYGHAYRERRAQALDGATHCATCGDPFTLDNPATGGHVVDLRTLPRQDRRASAATAELMPQCQRCNYGRCSMVTDGYDHSE